MRIGAYEVEGELGRGGMGVVYRARASDGRPVAIKLLARTASGTARDRFERERRLLAAFGESDGFVPLLDGGEVDGQPFLVMPLLPGGTLRERLRKGALPVAETIELATALALALSRAHAQGVIHRDLKPENVLYDAAERPFVADLGLAKHFETDSAGAGLSLCLSKTGQLLGTVGYMAPEQARDARESGPAADVFALGAILYECLSGWPAFEGRSVLDVIAKVERESPSPLANVRPDVPVWLAAVIERALERDPGARYADGGELLEALRRRESGVSPSRSRRVPGRVLRRALFAAPAILALGFLAVALLQGPRAPDERGREPPAPAPAASGTEGLASLAGRITAARARLEGPAPPSSADAPASLLAAPSREAAALRALAARRAVPYSLADGERLRGLFPGEQAATILWAISALGGAPAERDGAEAVLEGATEHGLARSLARTARIVDGLVARSMDVVAERKDQAPPSLVEDLRSLAAAPPASVDLAVEPLTEALVARSLKVEVRARISLGVASKLGIGDPDTQARYLPPRLRRACAIIFFHSGQESAESRTHALESIAAETSDALLGAACLGEAVRVRCELWRTRAPVDLDALEREGLALERRRAELEAGGAAPRALPASIGAGQRALAWVRIAEGRGDRAALLAGGEALAREALRADAADDVAAHELLRFLLEDGAPDRAALRDLLARQHPEQADPETVVLEIEARRVLGDVRRALADTDAQDAFENAPPYVHAVRALILADLGQPGQLDEAAREADLVPGPGALRPPIARLSREAVSRYVAERRKR